MIPEIDVRPKLNSTNQKIQETNMNSSQSPGDATLRITPTPKPNVQENHYAKTFTMQSPMKY